MFSGLKDEWRQFRRARPGRRFRDFHGRRRHLAEGRRWWYHAALWAAGAVLILVGLFFAVAPGPASLFILPGAILLATASHGIARFLDLLDRTFAPRLEAIARRWQRLPRRTRLVLAAVMTGGSVAALAVSVVVLLR